MRNTELRNKWIGASKRQNKNKTEWKPSETNSVPTLNLGYGVEEKKARKTLIRQALPKKNKIKENNDDNDEDDVVLLPICTTVTDSQPRVTCSTP